MRERFSKRAAGGVVCLAMSLVACSTRAQQPLAENFTTSPVADAALPDSPGTLMQAQGSAVPLYPAAPKFKRTIPADRSAVPLTSKDKFGLSLASQLSLTSTASLFLSAGISHLRNSAPHYGTDSGAFGERLGAAEIRRTSESVFSYGLFPSLFHQDPRYYVMGPKEKFGKRAIYAATRVVVTRKDDGGPAVNWSRFAGVLSAHALTEAYYPDVDRHGAGRIFSGTASSLAISAGTNELHEFLGDILHHLRHKHQDDPKP